MDANAAQRAKLESMVLDVADETFCECIAMALARRGISCRRIDLARNGAPAAEHAPSAAIVDRSQPFASVRAMASGLPDVPVLVLSGYRSTSRSLPLVTLGNVQVRQKPIDVDEMLRALELRAPVPHATCNVTGLPVPPRTLEGASPKRARPRWGVGYVLACSTLLAAISFPLVIANAPGTVAHARPQVIESKTKRPKSAAALYERILVPCCWTQTLDVHESELSDQLRDEIAERLDSGESALVIEDDLASRFGERVRAVPRGRDPRQGAAWFAMGAMAVALLALVVVVRRWVSHARARLGEPLEDGLAPLTPEEERRFDLALDRALRGPDAD